MNVAVSETRCILYARVSTEEQAREGVSLDAQLEAMRAHCKAQGWVVAREIQDTGSGKNLVRDGLRQALNDLAVSADALVVFKLDRLTRSVKDFCHLIEHVQAQGKALVSVRDSLDTESASGRLVANIMAAVAQWERDAISERTKDALAHKKAQGIKLGRPITVDAAVRESSTSEATRLRATGMTLGDIAQRFNENAIEGRSWHPKSVQRLLA